MLPNNEFEGAPSGDDFNDKLEEVESKFTPHALEEIIEVFGEKSFLQHIALLSYDEVLNTKPCDLRGDLLMTSKKLQALLADVKVKTKDGKIRAGMDVQMEDWGITNKHGLKGMVCAKSKIYRNLLHYQRAIYNIENQPIEIREGLDLDDKIERYSVSLELMLVRLGYLFGGNVKCLASLQNILVEEMIDLKESLEGFLSKISNSNQSSTNTTKTNWFKELDKVNSELTNIEEKTSSETCKKHIQNVYDLIDDIKYSI